MHKHKKGRFSIDLKPQIQRFQIGYQFQLKSISLLILKIKMQNKQNFAIFINLIYFFLNFRYNITYFKRFKSVRMKKQCKYIIKFISAKNQDGTVWYAIQVFNAKDDQSWTFRQRYSRMRDIHQKCMLTNKRNDLPQFPHKKLFGNTKQDFIQKRKKELENYYNTLLSSVDIQQLPDLLQFFNTNKPKKQKKSEKKPIDQQKDTKTEINKLIQLRKKFDQIARQTEDKLVQCDDFNNEIDDETRKRYNQEFQKMKLQLKSEILGKDGNIKGYKQTEDYWAFQLKDHHQEQFKKLESICKKISDLQITQEEEMNKFKTGLNFVIVL